jgi:hypothetical protein
MIILIIAVLLVIEESYSFTSSFQKTPSTSKNMIFSSSGTSASNYRTHHHRPWSKNKDSTATYSKATVTTPFKHTTLFSSIHRSNEAFNFHENDDDDGGGGDPRKPEFDICQDKPTMSPEQRHVRKLRLEREEDVQKTFVPYGNELWALRQDICKLSEKLIEDLSSMGGNSRNIRAKLQALEARDANIVYGLELDRMEEAMNEERFQEAEKHRELAQSARSHLAQFDLEGLWVGKYGDHGFGKCRWLNCSWMYVQNVDS